MNEREGKRYRRMNESLKEMKEGKMELMKEKKRGKEGMHEGIKWNACTKGKREM